MQDFITPPDHVHFLAKKLFGSLKGSVQDGSIAYLQKEGGGPSQPHTHAHNHLFIVVKGEAKLILDTKTMVLKENEAYLVPGHTPHSVWNNVDRETVMLGISIAAE